MNETISMVENRQVTAHMDTLDDDDGSGTEQLPKYARALRKTRPEKRSAPKYVPASEENKPRSLKIDLNEIGFDSDPFIGIDSQTQQQ